MGKTYAELLTVADLTALQTKGKGDSSQIIVTGVGLFVWASSGTANGTTVFNASGGGVWNLHVRNGDAVNPGSGTTISGVGTSASPKVISVQDSSFYFKPTDVSNCQLWLDASDAASVTLDASDLVGQINDKSGNARHLTQATTGNKPLYKYSGGSNNLAYIQMQSGKRLGINSIAISQPFTYYIVLKQNSFTNNAMVLDFNNGTTNGLAQYSAGASFQSICMVAAANWAYQTQNHFYNNNWGAYGFIVNGATSNATLNDSLNMPVYYGITNSNYLPNPGTAGTTNIYLGGNTSATTATFDFHELIIYSGIISEPDDKKIKAYLRRKYAISAADYIAWYGDSITQGFNSTNNNLSSFAALVSSEKGKQNINYGVTSTTVFRGGTANNFINTVRGALYQNTGYAVTMFGVNDAVIDAEWKSVYKSLIKRLLDINYTPSKVIICSTRYKSTEATKGAQIQTYCSQIASELGITYADVWSYTQANGGDSLLSDALHPSDTGHRVIADYLKTFIV